MSPAVDSNSAWIDLFARLFDAHPAQVALLDLNGIILQTNKSWRDYGHLHGVRSGYEFIGQNYLRVCEQAAEQGDENATRAFIGLLEVLHTQRPKFTMVYPCHSPTKKQWYRMWVEPQSPQLPMIVVAHYLVGFEQPAADSEPASFAVSFIGDNPPLDSQADDRAISQSPATTNPYPSGF